MGLKKKKIKTSELKTKKERREGEDDEPKRAIL